MNSATVQIAIEVDDRGSVKIRNLGKAAQEAGRDGSKGFDEIKRSMDASDASTGRLANSVKILASSYLSLQGVKALVEIADTYTLLEGRLRLVTGSSQELASVQQQLYGIAQQTRTTYEGTVDMYTRFARATKDTSISQSELMTIILGVNQALIVSGAKSTEAQAAMFQLSQGLASGTLRGEELNSVLEQTPRVAQMIADGMGITIGQLREFGEEGKLTSDVVLRALQSEAANVSKEFAQMPTTVGQAGVVLSNTLKDLVADANEGTGATNEIAKAILDVSTSVTDNRELILSLFTSIITSAGQAAQAILNIANSVKGFAAVAAGELDFTKFATMNAQDLKKWMADYESGVVQAQKRVDELAAKVKAFREQDPAFVDEAAWAAAERQFQAASKDLDTLTGNIARLKDTKDGAFKGDEIDAFSYDIMGGTKAMGDFSMATGVASSATEIFGGLIGKTGEERRAAAKAAREHASAERDALGSITDRMALYIDGAKDVISASKEWMKSADDALKGVADLDEAFQTAGMNDYERSLYALNKEFEKNEAAMAAYHSELEKANKMVEAAQTAYDAAVETVRAFKDELSRNTAGNTEDDNRKLIALNNTLEALGVNLKEVTDKRDVLAAADKNGTMNTEANTRAVYGNAKSIEQLRSDLVKTSRESENFFAGFSAGASDFTHDLTTMGELGYQTFNLLSDAWSDGFYAVITGDFDSLKDIWDSLLQDLLKLFIKWIAEMVAAWAVSEIAQGLGFNVNIGGVGGGMSLGSGSSSGWGSAATGVGSAAYGYFSGGSDGGGSNGGYGNFNYDADTGTVGGETNSFSAMDYGSAGKTAYDVYGNVTRVGTAAPAVTGMQALGGAVGVVGGAYGLYSAAQQLANGTADWKTGVQAGLSGYSLYSGYNTVAGYMGSEGLTGLGTAISQGVSEGLATAGQTVSSFFSAGSGATQAAPQLYNAYAGYEGLQAGAEVAAAQTGAQIGAQAAIPAAAQHGAEFAGEASVYGTGAGLGASLGAGAFSVGSAILMWQQSQKRQTYGYESPTLGINVPVEYGEDQLSAVRRGGERSSVMASEAFSFSSIGQGGDDGIARSYESSSAALADARANLDGYIDILANDFGDAVAQAGMALDGTAQSTDTFLDSIAGYDVSMQTSASITELAAAAAAGQSGATQQLRADLEGLGLSSTAANTAATALIAGVDGFAVSMASAGGEAIYAAGPISDASNALRSLDGAASSASGSIDSETGAMLDLSSGAGSATSAVQGMTESINTLSSTPLTIDLNVQARGISFTAADRELLGQSNHAVGGIFTHPTLLSSANGYRHQVAEAGQAEAITPLHAGPKTLKVMHDDIKALVNRPVNLTIQLDGKQIAAATMPSVDAHIAAKASRGQLSNRTVF